MISAISSVKAFAPVAGARTTLGDLLERWFAINEAEWATTVKSTRSIASSPLGSGTSTRPHGLEDAFVFAHDAAGLKPWRPNWVTKQFIAARKGAGLDHSGFMISATSWLFRYSAPVSGPHLSPRLAQSRASTTLNVYAHAIPGGDARRCRAHRWHRRCWAGLPTLCGRFSLRDVVRGGPRG
jgi:hypothetical protein